MLTRYIIYGLLGWCLEIFWTGMGSIIRKDAKLRAWTYLWMFPIYGMAVFLEPIHNFIRDWPILLRGGVYTLVIFFIEYLAGWFLENTIDVCPWDYSNSKFAVKGYIRLDYAPAWFTAGLLFEYLHDFLTRISI